MRWFGERYGSEDRMSDERTAEPAPGTPGQRALGAMESAVRRARESAGAPPLPSPPSLRAQPASKPVGASPPPLATQAATRRVSTAPPREERRPPIPPERTPPPAPSGATAPAARPE